jgi:hypothetical protein
MQNIVSDKYGSLQISNINPNRSVHKNKELNVTSSARNCAEFLIISLTVESSFTGYNLSAVEAILKCSRRRPLRIPHCNARTMKNEF